MASIEINTKSSKGRKILSNNVSGPGTFPIIKGLDLKIGWTYNKVIDSVMESRSRIMLKPRVVTDDVRVIDVIRLSTNNVETMVMGNLIFKKDILLAYKVTPLNRWYAEANSNLRGESMIPTINVVNVPIVNSSSIEYAIQRYIEFTSMMFGIPTDIIEVEKMGGLDFRLVAAAGKKARVAYNFIFNVLDRCIMLDSIGII